MLDAKSLNEIIQNLMNALPPAIQNMPTNIEKKFRESLQNGLTKMNLVSREEFDAQVKVLQRTREKLETLEKKLAEYERMQRSKNPTDFS